ncbi:uncharacterized protein [Pagrus major]|uniref:uncharacterized protein n=1 Tax=Pagrus major TaxID=143350 RepID=UPI003CC8A9D6
MMKSKLWAALCALLLIINLGSADHHDDGPAAATNASVSGGAETAPEAPTAEPVPVSSLDTISHAVTQPSLSGPDGNSSSRVINSLSSNTTTEGKNVSVTAETKKDNGTATVAPTEAAGPEKNQTDPTTPQPAIPSSGSHAPASPTPLTSTTTTTSLTSTAPTTIADASTTTTPPTNTSHQAGIPLPDSTAPSNTSSTTVPIPESPKSETTTTTTTTIVTQSTSTSSTSSTQGPLNTESHTEKLTSLQPDEHPETTTIAGQKSTVLPSSSTSAQAKAHADPSQLNDTTMVHNTPTLDPLLAGLVSAFIITAVIITLLLFLKLRRRDNRPEFRRLQDLPMDDMMEDTPLSMYSY